MNGIVAGSVWGGEYKDDWREMNEVIERTGRDWSEWMVLLVGVGLCGGDECKFEWRGERLIGENVVCDSYLASYLASYLSSYLSIYLASYLASYLSIYLSSYLSIYLAGYLSI